MAAGLVVIVSLISPRHVDRLDARQIVGDDDFSEVFVSTQMEVCESRDPKGLYRQARLDLIPNFTGISAPFEPPKNPDILLDGTQELSISVALLEARLEETRIGALSD